MKASPQEVVVVAVRGNGERKVLAPSGPVVRIGRRTDNDLVLDDVALSTRQCMLTFSEDGVEVADTRSNCGTFLDGKKIARGFLLEGSEIVVGNTRIRVERRA